MRKLLFRIASGIVLDVLLELAIAEYEKDGMSTAHYDRWDTIRDFIVDMKIKGIPL